MAQVFRRTTVLTIKLVLLGALLGLIALVIFLRWRMSPAVDLHQSVAQVIPFSHKHHVGDVGLDCRYCHTSVEKSAFAGLPATDVCLSCHSQLFRDEPMLAPLHASAESGMPLQWTRVHDLPDFVYFDHSIHIAKGIGCVQCHGRVDQMPLMMRQASLDMQWCLDCHRSAARHVRPLAEVFKMSSPGPLSNAELEQLDRMYQLQDTRRLTDCSTCHR